VLTRDGTIMTFRKIAITIIAAFENRDNRDFTIIAMDGENPLLELPIRQLKISQKVLTQFVVGVKIPTAA